MNPLLRASAAHVFVDSLDVPVLDGDDAHHLFRVLRLRDGEPVSASDGAGRWRPCLVRGGGLEVAGEVQSTDRPTVVIGAAIPKGDRLDWMVQKAVEVGVGRLVLLQTLRGVVRWDDDRAARQLDRLRRLAREASSQSRRTWLPEIGGPRSVAELVAEAGAALADPDGLEIGTEPVQGPILIGPEGGWDPVELAAADDAGARRISLGPTVLRVETAAVVAAVLASRGGMSR